MFTLKNEKFNPSENDNELKTFKQSFCIKFLHQYRCFCFSISYNHLSISFKFYFSSRYFLL